MRRVMIIGQPGSGKSTLAREIGGLTRLPVVHIDQIQAFLHYIWDTRRSARIRIERLVAEAPPEKAIFRLRNAKEVRAFLQGLVVSL